MLSALHFEPPAARQADDPARADVACFVGTVARRPGRALPDGVFEALDATGWLRGPWALPPERIAALDQVPVTIDSWDAFQALFAWDARPLAAGGSGRGATWLGAAVRAFFAEGGRRAVVVRVGDPWPVVGGPLRADARDGRLAALVPAAGTAPRPFDATDPRTWRGIEHLYGLRDVSHVCLPDLVDVFASEAGPLPVEDPPPPPPERFVECSAEPPPARDLTALSRIAAPRLAEASWGTWGRTVGAVCDFLRTRRPDVLMLASVPLPAVPVVGDGERARDWTGFLEGAGALREEPPASASAFVQMVWPWLGTGRAGDLAEGLEPPEGAFAGVLARNALERGTWRSVAGAPLPSVARQHPTLDLGLGPDAPSQRLGRRVCLVGPEPDGIRILSDVTASSDEAWRPGGVSRLMAALLRAAERVGEATTFDRNGPALWARIRRSIEALLEDFHRAGALRGATPGQAFTVRCDRGTIGQNDLDNGRVRVEVTVLPSAAIERITVSLELAPGGAALRPAEVA